ncbi:MAG: nucleotidyltransferase family protein [Vicinamibacterales bacterium]
MLGASPSEASESTILGLVDRGGAGVLLAWSALAESPLSDGARRRLETIVRDAAVVDTWRSEACAAALDRLAGAGVPALVMKGASLSLTCYPAPHLRPRDDDDLLVPEDRFDAALDALRAAGYQVEPQQEAVLVTRQRHLTKRLPWGVHQVDLHRRPLNPVAFDGLPAFDRLAADAVALPALGPSARGLGRVHTVIFLCAHRVAHHTVTTDQQWLLDLDLAASRLTDAEWDALTPLAIESGVAAVCAFELGRAVSVLGTPVPPRVLEALARVRGEASAAHLRDLGPLYVEWLNLWHLPDTAARLAFVRAHALPPAAYMRARFGGSPATPLAWLYARRLVGGLARWVREFAWRRRREVR